ncbi:MAG: NCS1 family nucleobase:cation symporter-1 [Deltaproteobacteria bacterium]|nr:NCS1 family nucleobase:cation symporter-1 [Deltaproteobacteria bacterium]
MHDAAYAAEARKTLPSDVVESPFYSDDLAPVPQSHRTWNTYAFAALWISMCHCIPTYSLAGGIVGSGMNWWQALLTIGVGTGLVLVPILLNAHPGTQYGVPFPVLARSSFGVMGANIPAMLRAVVACGWFGINCYFGGEGVSALISTVWPGWETLGGGLAIVGYPLPHFIAFAMFWAVNVWIIFKGMNTVRVFENWAAPLVLVMAGILLVWLVSAAHGFGALLSAPSKFNTAGEFFLAFFPWMTGVVGFWSTLALNIPDFTRFGKGQREQMLGQTLGLPTTMLAFSLMAVIITSAAKEVLLGMPADALWDPVKILAAITSPTPVGTLHDPLLASGGTRLLVALISVFGVGVATVSVNIAANVVSPANDIANLAPKKISFEMGGLITAIVGAAMLPWKLVSHGVIDWLIGYSALLGPIAGIMVVDYWVLRKKQLDVPELYRGAGQFGGINWIAVGAMFIGILPNVPGFLEQVKLVGPIPSFLHWLYVFAWFVGFFVAGGVYYAGMNALGKKPAPVLAG